MVIDELHAFAGDDRGWHLLSIFARIQRLAGRDLQRIGLSATVGNPEEMLAWLSSSSDRPKQVIWPRPTTKRSPDVQLDYVGSLSNAAKVIHLLHPKIGSTALHLYKDGYRDGIDAVDEHGCVDVPEGPGLGVEYDWDFILAHRTDGAVYK